MSFARVIRCPGPAYVGLYAMRIDGDADLLAVVSGDADAARHDSYLGAILSRVRAGTTDDALVESMDCDYVDVLELEGRDAA